MQRACSPVWRLVQGAGTVAHLIHAFWPERKMVGWELDGELLPVVRAHMGLQQLEDSGALVSTLSLQLGCSGVVLHHVCCMPVDVNIQSRASPFWHVTISSLELCTLLPPRHKTCNKRSSHASMFCAVFSLDQLIDFCGHLTSCLVVSLGSYAQSHHVRYQTAVYHPC